jgi:hypothetical protein
MADSRYPYTYACDFIRMAGPFGPEGVVLSRSDASQIRQSIADVLNLDDHELACKLANAELVREADPQAINHRTSRLMVALSYSTSEGDLDA